MTTTTQKPVINLRPLERTVVNTPTQQDYTTLMRVLECSGWRWCAGDQDTRKDPTNLNWWNLYKEETCIGDHLSCKSLHLYPKRSTGGIKVILPEEFYRIEKVTLKDIFQINRWFDTR